MGVQEHFGKWPVPLFLCANVYNSLNYFSFTITDICNYA